MTEQSHGNPDPAEFATPEACFDRCKDVSADYTHHLREQGIDARWIQVYGYLGDISKALPAWQQVPAEHWGHYVTKVGDVYHDWTARQFNPDAPVPLVRGEVPDWAAVYDITDALDGYLKRR